ncbi:MAG: ATP-dependent helicase, partial [Clostridia bacterium]|nr:ATP-dependent helicase [Clostridia bacterium]
NFDISPEAKFVLCNIGVVEDEENKKILEEKLVQFAVFDEKSVLIFINEESIKDWNVEKYEKEVKNLLKDKKLKIIQFLEDVRLYDFSDRDNVEIIIYDSNICLGQMFKFSEKGKLLRNYIYDIISIIYLAKKPSDNRMREIKLLQDSQDMTAYIKRTESQNKALLVLEKFMRLESFILSNIEEEGSSFNLKELNDAAIKEGVKASTVKNIRTINYFWTIKGYIHKSEFNSQNRTDYIPTIAVDKLLAKLDKRRDVCRFIVEELYRMSEKAPIKQDEEALVEFSLIGLYEAYKEAPKLEIYDTPVTSTDIEDALLYLSKIGAIALQCGFLVSYNGMEIKRLITDNKIRYKNEDYRLLSEFYKQKIQQIHIVGEYANLMVRDYNAALQFVNDYFQMDFKRFIARYFKGSRAAEIERNITPEKYNQLFGELSDKQSEIITDDESKYIVVAAGPGSGKTRVLVHKLASLLLLEDVKHEQLLMVTFSRAAATEFKKRLIKLIGNAAAFVEIKTFHSYCFDLLGKIGSLEESENVVKDAAELINNGEVELGRITKTVVVIDEAQDMDENEFALIKALMNRNDDMRIIAVGDDDQNIYEFRGSDSKHLKELIEDYGAKKYEMTENYRSGKNIINFANAFAKTIQSRMKTDNGVPVKDFDGVVKITKHNSNLEQPIVNGILERKHKGSVCVLTTTNDEALRVLGLLNRNNVPAKLIQSTDGFQMYNLAEVRYFLKQIDCELKTPVISDALWKSTKERLERFYGKSSCYEICLKMILDFEKINKTKYRTDLEEFIKESKYEDFYTEEKETILVSTIHKSKGREFDTVYMLLNNVSCVNDEEKRKIYVGLTRAKEELYIHCNNNLFDNIATNIVCDENVYDEPSEIMLQLSYRDVVLDFFKDKKDTIIKLRSGDVLQLEEEHLCAVINGKLVKVIKYSKAFKEKLDFLKAKGYEPTAATIRFILAWKGKDDENETAIVLPDLSLKKR